MQGGARPLVEVICMIYGCDVYDMRGECNSYYLGAGKVIQGGKSDQWLQGWG